MEAKFKDALTKKQEKALKFILISLGQRGYAPTVAEIGKDQGLTISGARMHIDALIKKGYLKRKFKMRRGLMPVEGVEKLVEQILEEEKQVEMFKHGNEVRTKQRGLKANPVEDGGRDGTRRLQAHPQRVQHTARLH
jgi:SOS-response transcriptional repressor LexA